MGGGGEGSFEALEQIRFSGLCCSMNYLKKKKERKLPFSASARPLIVQKIPEIALFNFHVQNYYLRLSYYTISHHSTYSP